MHGDSLVVCIQVFTHLTNRIHVENLVVSQKYGLRWNVHHPGGQVRFKRVVFLLQNNKNRVFSSEM
jgi:hypothetical protein